MELEISKLQIHLSSNHAQKFYQHAILSLITNYTHSPTVITQKKKINK